MNPSRNIEEKYESYLICDHGSIVCFYVRGIEAAIVHVDTGELELKDGARLIKFHDNVPKLLKMILKENNF